MRSRYSAYVVHDAGYLLRTWSPATRPRSVAFDDDLVWTGLEILASSGGSAFHTTGSVEFCASYRAGGRHDRLRESSSFVRADDGSWVYERGR